jgi:hypothetical protein
MELKTKRIVLSLAWGGLGVLLLIVALRSATLLVSASEAPPQSSPVIQAETQSLARSVSDWQLLLRDPYDGTYSGTYSIPRVITMTGSAPYQWGRVISTSNTFSDTLWSVQGGDGISLTAGIDLYTDNVTTTVTYGPIDMRKVVTAALAFSHWISVADGDGLEWGTSTDGASFIFTDVVPLAMGTWETTTLNSGLSADLAQLLGQPRAYLAFRFASDDDGVVDKGVFLDNTRLWVRRDTTVYLPFIFRGQYYKFEDGFGNATSGWPREWERLTSGTNIRGGYMVDRSRAQILAELMQNSETLALDTEFRTRFLGEDDDVYYAVAHDAWDKVFVSGPFQAVGDFSYEVKGRYDYAAKWHPGNRYGILITQEKVNPEDPHTIHGYSFYLEINPKSDGKSFNDGGWAVKEWYRTNWRGDDDGDEDRNVKGPHTSKSIKSEVGRFNKLKLEREGSTLSVYVNDAYLGSVQDAYSGPVYVGLFARHAGSGSTELSYDILFEWDEVFVESR